MNKLDKLLYELIYSDNCEFTIDLSEYIDDIYDYESFLKDIRKILRRAKVKILNNDIKLDSRTVIWKLKVSK